MATFTAFCQEASGTGTIWISAVEAETLTAALTAARETCAHAWGMEVDDIHVLGLAAGDVQILHWEDIND